MSTLEMVRELIKENERLKARIKELEHRDKQV